MWVWLIITASNFQGWLKHVNIRVNFNLKGKTPLKKQSIETLKVVPERAQNIALHRRIEGREIHTQGSLEIMASGC